MLTKSALIWSKYSKNCNTIKDYSLKYCFVYFNKHHLCLWQSWIFSSHYSSLHDFHGVKWSIINCFNMLNWCSRHIPLLLCWKQILNILWNWFLYLYLFINVLLLISWMIPCWKKLNKKKYIYIYIYTYYCPMLIILVCVYICCLVLLVLLVWTKKFKLYI